MNMVVRMTKKNKTQKFTIKNVCHKSNIRSTPHLNNSIHSHFQSPLEITTCNKYDGT